MKESNGEMAMPNQVQNIILENRKKLSISGVKDVDSFNEETIIAFTTLGAIKITGHELKVKKLSLEKSELLIEGKVVSISYIQHEKRNKENFLKRLFR